MNTINNRPPAGGKGGDVNFIVGKGSPDHPNGSFTFRVPDPDKEGQDKELIRIDPDGSFFYQGRKVEEDPLVYAAFRHWVVQAVLSLGRGCTVHANKESAPPVVCSSCEQEVAEGVVIVPDDDGGWRHAIGSPQCYATPGSLGGPAAV